MARPLLDLAFVAPYGLWLRVCHAERTKHGRAVVLCGRGRLFAPGRSS